LNSTSSFCGGFFLNFLAWADIEPLSCLLSS
jgi:hypothetical protein